MSDEVKLLGAILTHPAIVTELSVQERHFQEPNARRVFRAIQKCRQKHVEPTLLDVVEQDSGLDYAYVAGLTTKCPTWRNWGWYQSNVIAAYQKYRIRQLAEQLIEGAVGVSKTVDEMLSDAETGFTEILSEGAHDEIHDMGAVMLRVAERIEQRWQAKGELPGISTGIQALNNHLMGLEDGKLYVVAGRPSTGKSALLLGMARLQATRGWAIPGYISLESSELETGNRALAQQAKINSNKLISGLLDSERDFSTIMTSASEIGNTKWQMYDRANATLEQVRSVARRMVLFSGCSILYVDYLQIVGGQGKQESKYDHVTQVSMALKQLARDLNIPIVVAAQLNRAAHGKRPHMGELKESGQIEQDADAIMLLHRPNWEAEMSTNADIRQVTLIIEKNRDGALGDVDLHFNAPYTLFTEAPRGALEEAG